MKINVLYVYDPTAELEGHTDVSDTAISAMLWWRTA